MRYKWKIHFFVKFSDHANDCDTIRRYTLLTNDCSRGRLFGDMARLVDADKLTHETLSGLEIVRILENK